MTAIALDGRALTLQLLANDARKARPFVLEPGARVRLGESARQVAGAALGDAAVYGINTGFGAFANRRIERSAVAALQVNLVRSHACGVGEPLPAAIVRRMLILKANSLATGCSGVRPEVVDAILALVDHDVLPIVPRLGSVGASGDLAPLAHLGLALIGEGEARHRGRTLRGAEVMRAAGAEPLVLEAKEGLAILNGTQLSCALAIEGLFAAQNLLASSVAAGALTVEALAGSHAPFDARIHEARGLPGQIEVAHRFRGWLGDSEIHASHADCDRVQDPYAVRCMPQVLGAFADTLAHARSVLEREINAATDNPLVFGTDILSGGNFHAAPLGYVADFIAIAAVDAASMSERRIDLLDRRINPRLTMFMADHPGLESGFMIAHVAAAALASSMKTLAHPASGDSIPTSAGQEDHVSMAPWAGEKLLTICERAADVLAIEFLAAAHAIDMMRPLHTSAKLEALHARIRERVPFRREDHRLDGDIAAVGALVRSGALAA
ncbi:MAG: histidine ammonia-lyase [Steroidobacteraceae bacterium]|nr:histidine ammonia-lyase [Steroidobacteraceae bacterium]